MRLRPLEIKVSVNYARLSINIARLANTLKLPRRGRGTGALRDFNPAYDRSGSITSIALRTRVRLAPISDMSGDCQFRRDVPQAGMHRQQAPRLQRFSQILSIASRFTC